MNWFTMTIILEIGSCASVAHFNRLNEIIIMDPKSGLVFEKLKTLEEKKHSQYKMNFTLLKNDGLKEISCGRQNSEFNIAQSAWERMETSIK